MTTQKSAPVDRGCAVAVIIFILGLGTLLPWNFFITAMEYFDDRLKGTASSIGATLVTNETTPVTNGTTTVTNVTTQVTNGTTPVTKDYKFASWMTLLAQLPLLLFTLANSFLYQRIKEKVRIAVSMVSILFLFLLTAIMVKVPMQPHSFFSITMATIWFINSFGAVLQGSLFGLVGLLPPRYSTLFMSGQGLAGIFAAMASLFSILSKADKASAALGYFITPCVATLITLLSYLLLPHLEFAQFYFEKSKCHHDQPETTDELLKGADKEKLALVNGDRNGFNNKPIITNGDFEASGTKEALFMMQQTDSHSRSSVLAVFKKIWVMALCVTCVLAVTLSVFPAVTVKVKSVYGNKEWDRYFLCVCCFIVFNVMDLIGRSVTSMVQWPSKRSSLFPVLVVSRVVFIPLIMLCNTDKRQYLPVLFSHDIAFLVIMTLFALSNGYFICLCMSYAPQLVRAKDCETAGALMTFFLALGLSLGAALSFLLRNLL
ncbi:equilibrative nucleoside transporter 2-like isoform X1 [Salvelinus namaycush]|uniref:Equilibrative nucleoside transporter 2-like isoform X1 n=2 Tax=Salvelinus namaycush TaxID=8040 RepID=A0A8U0TLB1_SALNM|nr:equilibrative nucleoside transporter 2-like isoform X1 [Salvelinus namaycush]